MAKVEFKRGLYSQLPVTPTDGTIYVTTDEGAIYLGNGNSLLRLGDFVTVANVASLPVAGHISEKAIYYAQAENILARWNATTNQWIQLNKSGFTEISDPGSQAGNVITGITRTVNPNTGAYTLTITRDSVATSGAVDDLSGRVTDLETDMTVLKGNDQTSGSVAKTVKDAIDALKGNVSSDYDTLEEIEAKIIAAQSAADDAQDDADDNAAAIDSLEDRVIANENAIAILNGDESTVNYTEVSNPAQGANPQANGWYVSDGEGGYVTTTDTTVQNGITYYSRTASVAFQIAEIVANADARFDTLKEIADWILNDQSGAANLLSRIITAENNISDLQGDVSDIESDVDDLDTAINDPNTGLEHRMQVAEGKLDVIQGDASTTGSIAKAVSDLKEELYGAGGSAGANASYDTINEIAAAIVSMNTDIGNNADDITDINTQLTWGSF